MCFVSRLNHLSFWHCPEQWTVDTLGHSTGNTLMTDTMILNKVFQSREIFDYLIVGEHHHPPSDNITAAGSCVCLSRKPVEVTLYANIFSFHQIFSVFPAVSRLCTWLQRLHDCGMPGAGSRVQHRHLQLTLSTITKGYWGEHQTESRVRRRLHY